MSRRRRAEKRIPAPDPRYGDRVIASFANSLMRDGKRHAAEKVLYGAFDRIEKRGQDPSSVFHRALENVRPEMEVRSRRVGGATYQVPVEVRDERRTALAIRWIISAARRRSEPTMQERLAAELQEAGDRRGSAYKRREDTHRMAEANRAFAHYRW